MGPWSLGEGAQALGSGSTDIWPLQLVQCVDPGGLDNFPTAVRAQWGLPIAEREAVAAACAPRFGHPASRVKPRTT
eukprot:4964856-Pyramimonas_sp.AAC.1